ncbi:MULTISPECIES: maleylacetoacetate isomerase [unclassified Mesorhizobium]|uniref:maleylacetoacetate isomerase n=1 Tax=unclassified Mesorhizobium TaxID=325217 RepID=UPI001FF000AB|nr:MULTISPECIES: maleylacetoacetate isomerase [unclassified Mesorhizobium]
MKLRLHTRYQNSAGQRVRIVLNLKRLPYEYVAIPSLSSEAYRKLNPQGLMPALEVDRRVVAQSMAIIELLEELFPEPSILPDDPILRAEARSFAQLIAADLHPINNNRIRRYLADVLGADEPQVRAWYHHWVRQAFSSLEAQLAQQPAQLRYCFGDRPGLADACLVPQMDNARRFDCDLSQYPRLLEIDTECRKLEEFAKAAPAMQPDYPGAWATVRKRLDGGTVGQGSANPGIITGNEPRRPP